MALEDHDDPAVLEVSGGKLSRLGEVWEAAVRLQAALGDRAGEAGWNQMRPWAPRVRPCLRDVRAPVEGPVHRLPHRHVVVEQAMAVVERQPADAAPGLRPEPGLVDAVPVRDVLDLGSRERALAELARLALVAGRLLVEAPRDVQSGEVPRGQARRRTLPCR